MASGARIALTSPDPSSKNEHADTEHTIFSESDSDTVTFNAHDKETASSDAPSVSSKPIETDESASIHSHPQNVKITIDSVAPYEETDEEIQTVNRVDNSEESENLNEHTHDSHEAKSEERVTNDEL